MGSCNMLTGLRAGCEDEALDIDIVVSTGTGRSHGEMVQVRVNFHVTSLVILSRR